VLHWGAYVWIVANVDRGTHESTLEWRKPQGARVTAWIFVIAGIAVAVVATITGITSTQAPIVQFAVLLPESLLIAACAYVIGIRPRMVVDPSRIEVTNYLSGISIPWDAWTGATPGPASLVITSRVGNVAVAAVPGGGEKVGGKSRTEIIAQELSTYATSTDRLSYSETGLASPRSAESSKASERSMRPSIWMGRKRFVSEMAPKWGDAAASTQWWLLCLRLASVAFIILTLIVMTKHDVPVFIICDVLLLGSLGMFISLSLRSFREASRSLGVRIWWTSTPPNNADKYAAWCLSQGLKPYSASRNAPSTTSS
jgi:hypothetical protein